MIGFVGLSHLGIVSSIACASKGFETIGFDPDKARVAGLAKGQFPLFEPELEELWKTSSTKLKFTNKMQDLAACEVIYVSRDVPTNADNVSDPTAIHDLFLSVVDVAKDGSTIVILSQVSPGFTRELAASVAEKLVSKQLTLLYQVETLIFGLAVQRALMPERYMVGAADPTEPLPERFEELLKAFGCPILVMRYESAELAKISINMFLVSSVVTTNTLAELCENIGADWNEIAPALKLDKRIGPHAYLKPGLGIAGGNLERDLMTVMNLGKEHGTDTSLLRGWFENLAYRKEWVLRTLARTVKSSAESPTIGLWGLAYKANTDSLKNSPAIDLVESLPTCSIQAYDPRVKLGERFQNVKQKGAPLEVLQGADALVVMTPWKEFGAIPERDIRAAFKGRLIVDPYAALDGTKLRDAGFEYFTLGAG